MTSQRSARTKGLYTYPNKIGKKFGAWFYGDEKSIVRSRGSGMFGKTNPDHSGDLEVSLSFAKAYKKQLPDFYFNVELKHDKRWNLKELLGSPYGGFLLQSFRQSFDDSLNRTVKKKDVLAKYPILVFTKNYEADYVMFPVQLEGLGVNPFSYCGSFSFIDTFWEYEFCERVTSVNVVTCFLDDFLQLDPQDPVFKQNLDTWRDL